LIASCQVGAHARSDLPLGAARWSALPMALAPPRQCGQSALPKPRFARTVDMTVTLVV
jgi:hypothetical protein